MTTLNQPVDDNATGQPGLLQEETAVVSTSRFFPALTGLSEEERKQTLKAMTSTAAARAVKELKELITLIESQQEVVAS